MNSARMLFIGNFLTTTQGVASVSLELSRQLAAKGHVAFTTSKISNRFFRLLDMVLATLRLANKIDIAVIDVYSGNGFIWSALIGRLLFFLKKPFILILRGGNLPQYAEKYPAKISSLVGKAGVVVSPSLYLYERMKKHKKDIVVIPNPLNMEQYVFAKRNQPNAKLIWLRSFHEIYNPPLAIKVVKQLVSDFPDIALAMIGADKGDGSFQETVKLAKSLKMESRVSFPGAVSKNDVPYWMQKGDIFINTANIDNTPVSVMEAMACGLCVVSANVGGIPYLLEDEKDALLVPPEDAEAMATAVCRILTEPGLAEKLSSNARKKVEQFDWERILPQWENIFNALLQS